MPKSLRSHELIISISHDNINILIFIRSKKTRKRVEKINNVVKPSTVQKPTIRLSQISPNSEIHGKT